MNWFYFSTIFWNRFRLRGKNKLGPLIKVQLKPRARVWFKTRRNIGPWYQSDCAIFEFSRNVTELGWFCIIVTLTEVPKELDHWLIVGGWYGSTDCCYHQSANRALFRNDWVGCYHCARKLQHGSHVQCSKVSGSGKMFTSLKRGSRGSSKKGREFAKTGSLRNVCGVVSCK